MEKKLYFLKKTCGRKFLEEFIVSWKYRSQPMRNFYDNLPVLTPAFNTFNYWCFKPWCREGFHLSLCRRELSPHLLLVAGTHCCSAAPWALPKFHFSHPPTALKMTKHKKNRVRITIAIKLVKNQEATVEKLLITAGLFCCVLQNVGEGICWERQRTNNI